MISRPDELYELYHELLAQLRENKQYRAAATIAMDNLKNHEEAVELFCEGREWKDALLIAHNTHRLDLIGKLLLYQ